MKRLLFSIVVLSVATYAKAQTPILTASQFKSLKTSYSSFTFDCAGLAKPEYQYIFDFVKKPSDATCGMYVPLVTLTMQVHNTQTGVVTTYLSTQGIPGTVSCSKIDLNSLRMKSNTGLDIQFGGFLNPTTGRLATSLYLRTLVLTTDMPIREVSASIPGGGKVFAGSIQSGSNQVSAVLTIRNFCLNIGG